MQINFLLLLFSLHTIHTHTHIDGAFNKFPDIFVADI